MVGVELAFMDRVSVEWPACFAHPPYPLPFTGPSTSCPIVLGERQGRIELKPYGSEYLACWTHQHPYVKPLAPDRVERTNERTNEEGAIPNPRISYAPTTFDDVKFDRRSAFLVSLPRSQSDTRCM